MSTWPYNTARWKRLRLHVLSNGPLCRYCEELGHVTAAVDVDPVVQVSRDRERAFDVDNLRPLCGHCHDSVKQREERTGQRVGCDVNGEPLGGWKA